MNPSSGSLDKLQSGHAHEKKPYFEFFMSNDFSIKQPDHAMSFIAFKTILVQYIQHLYIILHNIKNDFYLEYVTLCKIIYNVFYYELVYIMPIMSHI